MPRGEKAKPKLKLPRKTYWHLYSLQTLQVHRLAEIVNKVLKREFMLVK